MQSHRYLTFVAFKISNEERTHFTDEISTPRKITNLLLLYHPRVVICLLCRYGAMKSLNMYLNRKHNAMWAN